MIISNISTPLLGLVDTIVMGHLDSARFLAAIALGGVIFNFIYWGFGFLRMGTTGLVAQAFGEHNNKAIKACLFRSLLLAWLIALILLLLQHPLSTLSFSLFEGSQTIENLANEYYLIRIWSAPATLSIYVLSGWFLGLQNAKIPLLIALITNLCNIGLDILFVNALHLDIKGVALASVIAEYIGLITALTALLMHKEKLTAPLSLSALFNVKKIRALLIVNTHLFLRTLTLIFAFAFFTAQSTRLGEIILAANTVLLNFQTFMAYALDGFAHAAEALVGKAIGQKNQRLLSVIVKQIAGWSVIIALGFSMVYLISGQAIIEALTGLKSVRETAATYLPWVIILPILSYLSYLFDGVFIGAMQTRYMQNAILFSVFAVYLPIWYYTQAFGNHGLWFSMAMFMLIRSLSMALIYRLFVLPGLSKP